MRGRRSRNPGNAVASLLREIRAAEERRAVRRQEHRQRPAAGAPREQRMRGLVDLVEVGALLAVDLDVDEVRVHRGGDLRILERLVRHHVAPVARRIADRQQDRLVLRSRASASAASPHGCQSTGLSACCSRYGLVSPARRFAIVGIRGADDCARRPDRQVDSSNAARSKSTPRCNSRVRRKRRSAPSSSERSTRLGLNVRGGSTRHASSSRDSARISAGSGTSSGARRRQRPQRERRRRARPQPQRQRELRRRAQGDAGDGADADLPAAADDRELLQRPAMMGVGNAHDRRLAPAAASLPALPRPVALGVFAPAVVGGRRARSCRAAAPSWNDRLRSVPLVETCGR